MVEGDAGPPSTETAMNRQVLAALVVVSATVLAGCGALGGAGSPTPAPGTASTKAATSTPTSTVTVEDTADNRVTVYGDLPVNATLVWERVESLLGGEYDLPTVSVRDSALELQTAPFAARLGLGVGIETFSEGRVRASYSSQTDRVRISPQNQSVDQVTRLLAHEYVHAIQYRSVGGNRTIFLDRVTERESSGVQRALIEGSAVYVEDAYTHRYLGFSATERRCAEYRNGTPYERYAAQPYCFGGRYFAETLDSPAELLSPDTTLPNTTEQVLHPESNEPPANLTVVDDTPTDWYTPASMDRKGELFVRTVLGVELPEQRAIDAAAGWGNDRLLTVTGDTEGYVWVLRWDTDADAREFESAFVDYLDARGDRTADGWRVDDDRYRLSSLDNRTVAVVTGNESFVDAVSVTERNGTVTVSASDDRG